MSRVLCCVMVAAVLGPLTAGAADPRAVARGIERYHAGDFEESVKLLQRAAAALGAGPVRARARLFEGLALAVLSRWPAARAAFAAALRDDPLVRPDPEAVRPSILRAFAEVVREVRGYLVVITKPRATVWVSGRQVGRTPLRERLPVGRYSLRMRADGRYAEYLQEGIVVRAGGTTRIETTLRRLSGSLTLTTRPPGAAVLLGKQRIGTTPLKGISLPAGRHQLRVELDGFRASVVNVQIDSKRPAQLSMGLSPADHRPWYRRRRIWGWISTGLAGGLLVAGAGFGLAARGAQSDLENGWSRGGLPWNEEEALRGTAQSRARLANVFFGMGAAAAITAVVLHVLGDPTSKDRVVRLQAGPTGLAVAGRF